MKKELIKLGFVAGIATTSLFGFTYEIKQGWQQLGAIKDFDTLSTFDDPNNCVEYLWHYDLDEPIDADKWKLHISDGKNYNYCGKTFSSLDKGDGFWLKASSECNITVKDPNNCNSRFPTPPSLDGSTCDTNVSNPDDTFTKLEATITYHGASKSHDSLIDMSGNIIFSDKPKTIKMIMGNLEIIYYNCIASPLHGQNYGYFEKMSINGILSKSNISASEVETFITNNISQSNYPYYWFNSGGYLMFSKEEQVNTIEFYIK